MEKALISVRVDRQNDSYDYGSPPCTPVLSESPEAKEPGLCQDSILRDRGNSGPAGKGRVEMVDTGATEVERTTTPASETRPNAGDRCISPGMPTESVQPDCALLQNERVTSIISN